jgi:hypothetical protein
LSSVLLQKLDAERRNNLKKTKTQDRYAPLAEHIGLASWCQGQDAVSQKKSGGGLITTSAGDPTLADRRLRLSVRVAPRER